MPPSRSLLPRENVLEILLQELYQLENTHNNTTPAYRAAVQIRLSLAPTPPVNSDFLSVLCALRLGLAPLQSDTFRKCHLTFLCGSKRQACLGEKKKATHKATRGGRLGNTLDGTIVMRYTDLMGFHRPQSTGTQSVSRGLQRGKAITARPLGRHS